MNGDDEIPASPRAGGYKVGDEVTMYGKSLKVVGTRPDGSPILDMQKVAAAPQAKAQPAAPQPTPKQYTSKKTVRMIGPDGFYNVPEDGVDDFIKEMGGRRAPTGAPKQADGAAPKQADMPGWMKTGEKLFGPPKGLEWLFPGANIPMRAAHMGMEGLSKVAGEGEEAVKKLGERGSISPGMTGAMTAPLNMAKSAGEYGQTMTSPGGAALGAISMHPLGRLITSLGLGGAGAHEMMQGASGMYPKNAKWYQPNPDKLQQFLGGGSMAAAGAAGVGEAEPKTMKIMKPTPEKLAQQGAELTTKSVNTAHPSFQPKLERAIQRGHLPEIERQYHPSTVREAADAVDDYMNNMLEKAAKEPLATVGRTILISGDEIAEGIQKLKTEEVKALAPDEMKQLEKDISLYKGKSITADVAYEHLKRLNQETAKLRNATPQGAAGAARVNAKIRSNVVKAKIMREQIYNKMQQLGMPIKDFNEDYGALTTVHQQLFKSIGRSEKIGKGEPLHREYLGYHGTPWLILSGMGVLSGTEGGGMVAAGASVVPFMRWAMKRRGTPNAMIDRAFGKFGKTGYQPPQQASYMPPQHALPQGPLPMPSSTSPEPMEKVGPMAQEPTKASGRTIKGKEAPGEKAGRYKRFYTSGSKDRTSIGPEEHAERKPEITVEDLLEAQRKLGPDAKITDVLKEVQRKRGLDK